MSDNTSDWLFFSHHNNVMTMPRTYLARDWKRSSIQNMAVPSGRVPSSTCYCPARRAAHIHCFCRICNGKAVNYRTQISHLNLGAFCNNVTPAISEEEMVENERLLDHEATGVDNGTFHLLSNPPYGLGIWEIFHLTSRNLRYFFRHG